MHKPVSGNVNKDRSESPLRVSTRGKSPSASRKAVRASSLKPMNRKFLSPISLSSRSSPSVSPAPSRESLSNEFVKGMHRLQIIEQTPSGDQILVKQPLTRSPSSMRSVPIDDVDVVEQLELPSAATYHKDCKPPTPSPPPSPDPYSQYQHQSGYRGSSKPIRSETSNSSISGYSTYSFTSSRLSSYPYTDDSRRSSEANTEPSFVGRGELPPQRKVSIGSASKWLLVRASLAHLRNMNIPPMPPTIREESQSPFSSSPLDATPKALESRNQDEEIDPFDSSNIAPSRSQSGELVVPTRSGSGDTIGLRRTSTFSQFSASSIDNNSECDRSACSECALSDPTDWRSMLIHDVVRYIMSEVTGLMSSEEYPSPVDSENSSFDEFDPTDDLEDDIQEDEHIEADSNDHDVANNTSSGIESGSRQSRGSKSGRANLSGLGAGGRRSRANRKRGKSDDDDEEEENPNKKGKIDVEDEPAKPVKRIACPFFKHDSTKFEKCGKLKLPGVWRLKEHFSRYHSNYCPRCYQKFPKPANLSEHLNKDVICQKKTISSLVEEGFIEESIRIKLKDRHGLKFKDDEQKWREIYVLLYPNTALENIPDPYIMGLETAKERKKHLNSWLINRLPKDCNRELEKIIPENNQELTQARIAIFTEKIREGEFLRQFREIVDNALHEYDRQYNAGIPTLSDTNSAPSASEFNSTIRSISTIRNPGGPSSDSLSSAQQADSSLDVYLGNTRSSTVSQSTDYSNDKTYNMYYSPRGSSPAQLTYGQSLSQTGNNLDMMNLTLAPSINSSNPTSYDGSGFVPDILQHRSIQGPTLLDHSHQFQSSRYTSPLPHVMVGPHALQAGQVKPIMMPEIPIPQPAIQPTDLPSQLHPSHVIPIMMDLPRVELYGERQVSAINPTSFPMQDTIFPTSQDNTFNGNLHAAPSSLDEMVQYPLSNEQIHNQSIATSESSPPQCTDISSQRFQFNGFGNTKDVDPYTQQYKQFHF